MWPLRGAKCARLDCLPLAVVGWKAGRILPSAGPWRAIPTRPSHPTKLAQGFAGMTLLAGLMRSGVVQRCITVDLLRNLEVQADGFSRQPGDYFPAAQSVHPRQ
jgi:hypothetical protein